MLSIFFARLKRSEDSMQNVKLLYQPFGKTRVMEMTMIIHEEVLKNLAKEDTRYTVESYKFLLHCLGAVQQAQEKRHVSGQDLCVAFRDFGCYQFGLMARTVFDCWGIRKTEDIGNLVYNLIGAGIMRKQKSDKKGDFKNVFDFNELEDYKIELQ